MKKLLLLLPIVALIVGCGGDEEEEQGTIYLPLSVGNEWNYDVTATVTNPDTTWTGSFETEITAETTLDNGTEVFEWVQVMTIDTISGTDTFYLEETENYILMYSSKTATVPDTFLALPLEVGKTWGNLQVLGQADVTVPAGTFNDCWEILETSAHGSAYYYFAADVGLVKLLKTETDGTIWETLVELETYYVE